MNLYVNKDIDIIFIGLPNSMHEHFCLRALEFNKNVLVDSETINKSKEVDGKTIFDTRTTNDTFKDLDKDWTTRSTTVEDTAGNTTTNRLTPTGMWENDVYLGNRGPQNMAIDPPKSFDLPGNNLRADLTPKQKELLDQRKGIVHF